MTYDMVQSIYLVWQMDKKCRRNLLDNVYAFRSRLQDYYSEDENDRPPLISL